MDQPVMTTMRSKDNKDCLLCYEGRGIWVPFFKVQELDKMIQMLTKTFWGDYFQQEKEKELRKKNEALQTNFLDGVGFQQTLDDVS